MKPCRNGHTEGRYPSGVCKACAREQKNRYIEKQRERQRRRNQRLKAERGARAETRLPVGPLAEFLRSRCMEYADTSHAGTNKGHKELARRVAPRLGLSEEDTAQTLERILNYKNQTVMWPTADAWCCALDIHISGIYSEAELRGDWERPRKAPVLVRRCSCGRAIIAKAFESCHVCRKLDKPFACSLCDSRHDSNHGLYLHGLQAHGVKTEGRHTWRTNKAVVG